jgi:hypothetical protein
VNSASQRYYEEKIEPYFSMRKFVHESFDERSSVFSLKELLEQIVARSRQLRTYRESEVIRLVQGRPPTSHFHIIRQFDTVMASLELNFFLTKYYGMKDRDGRDVSVCALNYGLCEKYTITFGRPAGDRKLRTYVLERIFDYTPILKEYIARNQEIRCASCGTMYGVDKLDSLRLFQMLCPTCKKGLCEVVNLSRRYQAVLEKIDASLLLPATEMSILQTLHTGKRAMYAAEIAGELDCSYQLVGKRGIALAHRGLVDRNKQPGQRTTLFVSNKAEMSYFLPSPEDSLTVE